MPENGMKHKNNKSDPLVSIVIPVFNGSLYLASAIDSALAQTYKNIEVIVVNDGSDDSGETSKIAKSYGNRIFYLEKPNGGVASALNKALDVMKGEYFSWLSHDDLYKPDKIRKQIDMLSLNNYESALVFSDFEIIDEKGNLTETIRLSPPEKSLYCVLRHYINGCSVLLPAMLLREEGGFNEKLKGTQDYEMWFRLARRIPFIHVPDILVSYRVHPTQGNKTQTNYDDERNLLFISFFTRLERREILNLEESVGLFYIRNATYLEHHGLYDAAEFAYRMYLSQIEIEGKRHLIHKWRFLLSRTKLYKKMFPLWLKLRT
jgi:glycosyltransferase involved in cell wall biosynthesis